MATSRRVGNYASSANAVIRNSDAIFDAAMSGKPDFTAISKEAIKGRGLERRAVIEAEGTKGGVYRSDDAGKKWDDEKACTRKVGSNGKIDQKPHGKRCEKQTDCSYLFDVFLIDPYGKPEGKRDKPNDVKMPVVGKALQNFLITRVNFQQELPSVKRSESDEAQNKEKRDEPKCHFPRRQHLLLHPPGNKRDKGQQPEKAHGQDP